jgi:hypothetical protein
MKKIILGIPSKVFALKIIDQLIEHTRLKEFKTNLFPVSP